LAEAELEEIYRGVIRAAWLAFSETDWCEDTEGFLELQEASKKDTSLLREIGGGERILLNWMSEWGWLK